MDGRQAASGRRAVDVSVVSSGHHVADARLHRHCAALRRAGLSVEVIARGAAGDAPVGADFRPLPGRGRVRRGLSALVLPIRARGRVMVTLDPELVPSARLRRALWPGRRLVVDVHEDYLALLADRAWARGAAGAVARGWARSATLLSRGADVTAVADEHVPPLAAVRRMVVRNLPDFGLLPSPSALDPVPRALYVGDVRESRGLSAMLWALEAAPDWELDIVGPLAPAAERTVERWRATSPAAGRVRFHGRMPPQKAWALARGAWAGIALLEGTRAFSEAIPSKVYEYLACGLPVLTSPLPRAARLVEDAGAGAVAADGEAAGAVLAGWSGQRREAHRAARAAALRWSAAQRGAPTPYDELAFAVAELLDRRPPLAQSVAAMADAVAGAAAEVAEAVSAAAPAPASAGGGRRRGGEADSAGGPRAAGGERGEDEFGEDGTRRQWAAG
ncbi:glycosyltransferase [Phaeacidiphilus oryzae]|uniref:glycosyltransferase n=1 Tax=Phaeacidiphilus oryzae TaxID=348818 RepID=UPI0007C73C87|nr:glycosyltransferase [Phaeacidiphilus oryzae]